MTIGVGEAYGKIIVLGEHSVVYGAYAIALPFLATKAVVRLSLGNNTLYSSEYTGDIDQTPKQLHGFATLFNKLKEHYGDRQQYAITIDSSIPIARGMGSSAAIANALIFAYANYHNLEINHEEHMAWSMVAETINHGNPSGIDAYLTKSLVPIYFKKGGVIEPIVSNLSGYMIVVDSLVQGHTLEAVDHVASIMNLSSTQQTIQQLNDLSLVGKQAIESDDIVTLGSCMNQAHALLDELGVSHPVVNHLVQLATLAGARGAKMTGGGRGGVMVALVEDEPTKDHVLATMNKHGYHQYWVLPLKDAFL